VTRRLIVDGNNVMGAVPDGWWRDRKGAARRLLGRVQRFAASVADDLSVTLVFDVPDRDVPEGEYDGVRLVYATRSGRDAGDDRIRDLLAGIDGEGDGDVEVVTSDRALATSARAAGATVTGAGTFLDRLNDAGC
jgi:predicted RNA-binding protein with PIN domain